MVLEANRATVLLTGATGNIGARILVELLGCTPSSQIVALVRGNSDLEARSRLSACVRRIAPDLVDFGQLRAVEVVCGDITDRDIGLTASQWRELTGSVTHVIHAAASTQWHLPLDCAREVNVTGTVNMLRFALEARRVGSLRRYVHLSTAYVCGEMDGTIREVNHAGEAHFANTYEQTKWEAEQKLFSVRDKLPITIVRPSVTVGDSRTGLAVTYNVLYPPLKYILTGRLTKLCCPPQNRLDLVPVDYVARSVIYLALNSISDLTEIYHLTAGTNRSMSIATLVERAVKTGRTLGIRPSSNCFAGFQTEVPCPNDNSRKMSALIDLYSSYLHVERAFDDTNTRQVLAESGIQLPELDSYLDTLLSAFITSDVLNHQRPALGTSAGGAV